MTTTVRLLATYNGNPPQTIVRLPDALAATFVAQGNASLDLTGGKNVAPPAVARVDKGAARLLYSQAGAFLGLGDGQGNLLLNPAGATLPGGATKPAAPTGLTLTASAGAVIAAFTASASDGGAPIEWYEVTLSTGAVVRGDASPIYAAATPGTDVTATVRAVNAVGKSDASNTSNSVKPTGAAPPLFTNTAVRAWQLNPASSAPRSVYNGNGLDLMPVGAEATGTCMLVTDWPTIKCTGFRLLMGNMSSTQPRRVNGFTAVSPAATGDSIYDAAFASAPVGTFNGGQAFIDVPARSAAATSPGLAISDFYPLAPVARTDNAAKRPLLAIRERAYYTISDGTAYTAPYIGRTGAQWGTDNAGILLANAVNGDKLNSAWPTNAAPSANNNCAIMGIIFYTEDNSTTVFLPGSSLVKNDLNTPSTKKGSGWPHQSVIAASTSNRVIEYINGGQAGQQLDKGVICAQEVFRVLGQFITHTCIEFANPNNLSAPTTTVIDNLRAQTDQIKTLAEANGSRVMYWNGWSRNVSSTPWLASYYTLAQDNLRKAYLEEIRARGAPYMDTNILMNRGTSPDQVKMIGSGDPYDFATPAAGDGLHETNDATTYALTPGFTTFWTTEITNKYWA